MTNESKQVSSGDAGSNARIAIPIDDRKLCAHFGHCSVFAFFDVKNKTVVRKELVPAPPHQPGLLPAWLHEKQATVVIVGGMGTRAKDLLAQHEIQVIDGVSPDDPETIVASYLAGTLAIGESFCDH
ncbi:ATPase [bacterium]|nr:ATPase [bacterium]MBU1936459.1 ATPase [bacterium]